MAKQDADQTDSMKEAAYWHEQIKQCETDRRTWMTQVKKIVRRYRDERADKDNTPQTRRMNLLWSNVETLSPAVYGKQPVPIAERRYKDKDPVGRAASTILERSLRYEMEPSGFDTSAKQIVQDYLLAGRGTPWVRYCPEFGDPITVQTDNYAEEDGEKSEPNEEDDLREVTSEGLEVDYIHYNDFYHGRARYWSEVPWVGKRVFMTRKAMKARKFKDADKIPLTHSPQGKWDGEVAPQSDQEQTQAVIYEIWCKDELKVFWIAKDWTEILDEKPDPLNLKQFWPCPRPLFATITNDSMIPVPDFVEYQDQADEIDSMTNRIAMLAKALKAAGVYAAAEKDLARLLEEGSDNVMIPVAQWAMFAEKGGLAGVMSFLPIKEVAEVLSKLTEARNVAKNDLYELTGIADIIRGVSDPNETMGAQKLKSNYANLRLKDRQDAVAKCMRDTLCIMGEIIAEHFSPETLIEMSGAMFDEGLMPPMPAQPPQMPSPPMQPGQQPGMMGAPPPPDPRIVEMQQKKAKIAFLMQAVQLLKNDKMRGFRIDIETDSTIQGDQAQEKSDRIEFITAATKFLEAAAQIGAQIPEATPLMTKMLGFGIRGFRVSRDLEAAFDEFSDEMDQKAKKMANAPRPPSPEEIKARSEREKAQADIAQTQLEGKVELERQQMENAGEQKNNQMDIMGKKLDFVLEQFKAMAEMKKMEAEQQSNDRQLAREEQHDAASHERKMEQIDRQSEVDKFKAAQAKKAPKAA